MKEIYLDRHKKDCKKDYWSCNTCGFLFFFGGQFFILHYNKCFIDHLRMKKGNYYLVQWNAYDEAVMMISHVLDEYKLCDKYSISKSRRADEQLKKFRIHGVKFKKYITHINLLYGASNSYAVVTEVPFTEGIYTEKEYFDEYYNTKNYLKEKGLYEYLPQLESLHSANFYLTFDEVEAVKTTEALRLSILHTINNR